jgi:hypothetical protein
MQSLWKMAKRSPLAIAIFLGIVGSLAGFDGAMAQGSAPVATASAWANRIS